MDVANLRLPEAPSSAPAQLRELSECCGFPLRPNLHHILRYDSNDAVAHIIRVRRLRCECGNAEIVGVGED